MAEYKPAARKKREPKQTTFIQPAAHQFKNNDILDIDEAAALLKLSRRTVYNRVKVMSHSVLRRDIYRAPAAGQKQ